VPDKTPALFTVCTPTFNRARLLQRAYDSLACQTLKDFEWLVVDDGSTDNTGEVIAGLIANGSFPIRYYRKANGGKHTALNLAVREARGTLFTIIDSDDWFLPDSLERMKRRWEELSAGDQARLTGVCGLFGYESGEILGDKFPSDPLEADDLELKLRYRIHDDKIGFTRTEVMREFPFPEFPGHTVRYSVICVPESIVWNRMGCKYPTRFVNEVFAVKQYQTGGITLRGRLVAAENSAYYLLYVHELLTSGRKLPLQIALKSYSNYIRHSLHQNVPWLTQMSKVPAKHLFLACVPIGLFLWQRDRRLLLEQGRRLRQAAAANSIENAPA
jgi:glycosyltransferase involved in cell wall biosynthesis